MISDWMDAIVIAILGTGIVTFGFILVLIVGLLWRFK